MKASIQYLSTFTIPNILPHAQSTSAEDYDPSDEIFHDSIGVEDGCLCLHSRCGDTRFSEWEDMGDHYRILSGTHARYEGALNALNRVWGIEFPQCEVTMVDSTIGHFSTLEDYELARNLVLPVMRNVERFLNERRDTHPAVDVARANRWLERLAAALTPLVTLDHLGNPIHEE